MANLVNHLDQFSLVIGMAMGILVIISLILFVMLCIKMTR